ncbi:MAG: hypothetical protein KKB90_02000 [Actinobacteria bacterium]|nr:hypothetical protein [Actinomycetota bacterium]MCG2818785.1 hypothetical protein [Actinomycetes bacterium]MBU4217720.1 hypothetical protein [Actinomycetota bacterium]MBU4358967.1 hypothetical protein [Actinomycetota bacterium]MBU4391692.1 hypothetical protein [Actinomycetota bacterium]
MISPANRRYGQIGLDRLVRLKWLERTAYLVMAGNEAPAVKAALQGEVQGSFRSDNTKIRGSLDKTITILMKIWVRPPYELHSLQGDGLKLLSSLPREDHIAVHWGIAMAVYPFWGAVAAHVGRLLRLQGTAAAGQVQRRLREQYGERETVSRRVRYVLRSFVDWGVLDETSDKGVYNQGVALSIQDPKLITWLIEASLHARMNGSAAIKDLLDSPSIFPFRLAHVSAEHLVSLSPRLDLLRHGLDDDLVMLREESQIAGKGGVFSP